MRTLPKGPERLSCEIGMLAPQILETLETATKNNSKKTQTLIFTGPGLAEVSNGCIVLDEKMCPDPLDALTPSGTTQNPSNLCYLVFVDTCPMFSQMMLVWSKDASLVKGC